MQKNSFYILIETLMLVVKVSSEAFLTKYNQLMSCSFFFVCFFSREILLNIVCKCDIQNKETLDLELIF